MQIRKIENIHIFLWLLKDLGWVQDIKFLGMFMVLPTLSVAIYIAIKMRRDISELTHNLAVCSWIIANSIWMAGEFFYDDQTRPIATIFFVLGLAMIVIYYSVELMKLVRRPSQKE